MRLVIIIWIGLLLNLSIGQESLTKYNLESFTSALIENSDEIELLKNENELSGLLRKDAFSEMLPQIYLEGAFTRFFDSEYLYVNYQDPFLNEEKSERYQVSYRNNVYLTGIFDQTLFNLKNLYNLKAANSNEKAADYLFKEKKNQFICESQKLFLQHILIKKMYRIYKELAENSEKIFHDAKIKYSSGLISELDFIESEIRNKEISQQKLEYKRYLNVTALTLKQLIGAKNADSQDFIFEWDNKLDYFEKVTINSVLESNPLINSLTHDIKTKEFETCASISEFAPKINARISYNYAAYDNNWDFSKTKNNVWKMDLVVQLPIFTGFYRANQIAKSKVNLRNSQVFLSKVKNDVQTQFEEKLEKLEILVRQIDNAELKLNLAKKSIHLAKANLESGLISQIQFSEIFNKSKEANFDYYSSVIEYHKTLIDYKTLYSKQ